MVFLIIWYERDTTRMRKHDNLANPCIPGSGSLVIRGGKPAQRLYRGDEVIGAADCRRIPGQGITDAVFCSGHTSEHAGQTMLVAAEADKHRPMLGGRPERGIAAEDVLYYPALFALGARHV